MVSFTQRHLTIFNLIKYWLLLSLLESCFWTNSPPPFVGHCVLYTQIFVTFLQKGKKKQQKKHIVSKTQEPSTTFALLKFPVVSFTLPFTQNMINKNVFQILIVQLQLVHVPILREDLKDACHWITNQTFL